MGYNPFKEVKKAVSKVSDAVSSAVSDTGAGLTKIREGNIAEGLGDIGQTAARTGFDTVTGGNKDLADMASSGAISRAESAARGNTKDIASTGAVVGAAFAGGPAAAMAMNQGIATYGGLNAQTILNATAIGMGGNAGAIVGKIADAFTPKPNMSGASVWEQGYESMQSGYDAGVGYAKENPLGAVLLFGGLAVSTLLVIKKIKKG